MFGLKVHWKWSQRITRLLIQCLESTEYMEIRNALIMLTKISSVFPVTRKSGINIEKRVSNKNMDIIFNIILSFTKYNLKWALSFHFYRWQRSKVKKEKI